MEQNHNLIYSAMRKFGIKPKDFDDYYGVAAIGLCKAALNYDEIRGSFSTVVYSYILNEFRLKWRDDKRLSRKINNECVSYNINFNEWKNNFADNALLVDENFENNFILLFQIKNKWNTLNNRQKQIFSLYLQGYGCLEIGRIYGISRQRVSKIILTIKSKLR